MRVRVLLVLVAILALVSSRVDGAARVKFNSFKEVQVRTFRKGDAIDPKWGTRLAAASNGKAAVVSSLTDSVQFLSRAPYGWIETGPRVTVPGAVTRPLGKQGFGPSVGMSGDGKTAIVGGSLYVDNIQERAVAWIFAFASNRTWVQQTRLAAPSSLASITAPAAVAISDDGNTAAVGAMVYNGLFVYVFVRSDGAIWTQQAILNGQVTGPFREIQKQSLTLSASGDFLAVGADDSNNRGAVYIFKRLTNEWIALGSKLIGSGAIAGSLFGASLSLSGDGLTLVVGGWGSIAPPPANNTNMGKVWIFTSNGITPFIETGAPIVPSNLLTTASARFGSNVAISKDGKTFVVGAPYDDASSGSFFVYQRPRATLPWRQTKIAPSSVLGAFGTSVSVSGDGKVLVTGAPNDDGKNGTLWFYETKDLACQI